MHLLYVDESGNPGTYNGINSKHYILTGLTLNQNDWQKSLERLKIFRKKLKSDFGLNLRTEIHAVNL